MIKNIRIMTPTTIMAMMMVMVIKMMTTTPTIVMVNIPGSYLR